MDSIPQEEEQEEAHRLSFCDLPISAATSPPPSAPPDHLFSFSSAFTIPFSNYNDVVFCGKIINDDDQDNKLNDFRRIKSQSLRKPASPATAENQRFSVSTRFAGEISRSTRQTGDVAYHAHRVNITSLTTMSAKSRRRMFMFGPVKFKPEMELSEIKERQAKMAEKAAEGGGKRRWEVVKASVRGRSHLGSVLARSLGCIPVAAGGGGFERWVEVAN